MFEEKPPPYSPKQLHPTQQPPLTNKHGRVALINQPNFAFCYALGSSLCTTSVYSKSKQIQTLPTQQQCVTYIISKPRLQLSQKENLTLNR